MRKSKIVFVIPDLQQGGAERVVSIMANYWAGLGHNIFILTFNNEPPYFFIDNCIKVQSLYSAKQNFWVFNFLINNISRTINYIKWLSRIKPNIIISFTDNANVYVLLYNLVVRKPVIIAQRTNPIYNTLPAIIKWTPKYLYRRADAIVVQTRQTLKIYEEISMELPQKRGVIYNPLPTKSFNNIDNLERKNIIIAVGRLNIKDKHFDKLISIFSSTKNTGWQLHIAGIGPDRLALEKIIAERNLENKVTLLGSVLDTSPLYQSAKIFVLTSKFEGFPNALCEAMANGCACISYDCPTGPSELINTGVNGILIEPENSEAFGVALSALMNDEEMIKRLSSEAKKISGMLDEEKIMTQWESLIDDILKDK